MATLVPSNTGVTKRKKPVCVVLWLVRVVGLCCCSSSGSDMAWRHMAHTPSVRRLLSQFRDSKPKSENIFQIQPNAKPFWRNRASFYLIWPILDRQKVCANFFGEIEPARKKNCKTWSDTQPMFVQWTNIDNVRSQRSHSALSTAPSRSSVFKNGLRNDVYPEDVQCNSATPDIPTNLPTDTTLFPSCTITALNPRSPTNPREHV